MSAPEPRGLSRRREPMFNAPFVVVLFVVILLAIHAAFSWAPDSLQDTLIRDFAFIPGRLTIAIWPQRLFDLIARAQHDPIALAELREIRGMRLLSGGPKPWTLLTYALLHGSWTHVALNTVWLIAFGPPVARRFGSVRFVLFMAVTAIFSALAHWASAPLDFAPLIGASGADSGLMGAATRFMFQPGAPLGSSGFLGRTDIESIPAARLIDLIVEPRARIFLIVWLGTNFIFGAGAQKFGLSDMPVAWVAHLGGFFSGLVLFPLFDRPRLQRESLERVARQPAPEP